MSTIRTEVRDILLQAVVHECTRFNFFTICPVGALAKTDPTYMPVYDQLIALHCLDFTSSFTKEVAQDLVLKALKEATEPKPTWLARIKRWLS
jgi:hypothetical protein